MDNQNCDKNDIDEVDDITYLKAKYQIDFDFNLNDIYAINVDLSDPYEEIKLVIPVTIFTRRNLDDKFVHDVMAIANSTRRKNVNTPNFFWFTTNVTKGIEVLDLVFTAEHQSEITEEFLKCQLDNLKNAANIALNNFEKRLKEKLSKREYEQFCMKSADTAIKRIKSMNLNV